MRFFRTVAASVFLLISLNLTFAQAGADFCTNSLTSKVSINASDIQNQIPFGTLAYLDHVTLGTNALPVIFLGKFRPQDQSTDYFGFFDQDGATLHFVNATRTKIVTQDQSVVGPEKVKLWVRNENQEGADCAAYSLYHCLRQISFYSRSLKALKDNFVTESMRIKTLVESINTLYYHGDEGRNMDAAVKKMAEERGLNVYSVPKDSIDDFRKYIVDNVLKGWPILIRFNVEPVMLDQSLTILDHSLETLVYANRNLWVPFTGQLQGNSAGGHAIVLLGAFEAQGKKYFLVSDPNWGFPRLWPQEYLQRTTSANIQAWQIWFP